MGQSSQIGIYPHGGLNPVSGSNYRLSVPAIFDIADNVEVSLILKFPYHIIGNIFKTLKIRLPAYGKYHQVKLSFLLPLLIGVKDEPQREKKKAIQPTTTGKEPESLNIFDQADYENVEPIYSSSAGWLWPSSWSPDGRWLAFARPHPERQGDVYALRIDSAEHVIPVAVTEYVEGAPQFSPDGRWIAYQSNETGRRQVYVVSFPEISGKQQVSNEGGGVPQWSRAGDELFFWQGRTLMSAGVSMAEGVFRSEPAQPLFDVPDRIGPYAFAPDGERFLVLVRNPESQIREIHVVLNWFEVLRGMEGTQN